MSSHHEKPKSKLEKDPNPDEITAMKEHFNRRMDILNAALAHLKEIREEVETKSDILATFMKEVDAAIKKALKNVRETAYPSNPACRKADDVLRNVKKEDKDDHRVVLLGLMRYNLNDVKKKLEETKKNLEELQKQSKESHKEQKIHAKRIRELQEGNKEATEKAEKIAALVDEVDAAMKKVRSQYTETARPEIEACQLADSVLAHVTCESTCSRTWTLRFMKVLKDALKDIKSEFSWVEKVSSKLSKDWESAEKKVDTNKLRGIQKKLEDHISSCRKSDYTKNLV